MIFTKEMLRLYEEMRASECKQEDEMRRDAERYRWLRDNGCGERDILWDYQGEELDRVIDSEISREKGANV